MPLPIRPSPMNPIRAICVDDLYSRASLSVEPALMPIRKMFIATALLLTTTVFADDVATRKEVFHNDRVAAYSLEIPPQQTSTYRRDKDNLTVLLSGARAGETQYKHANAIQNIRNDESTALRALVL